MPRLGDEFRVAREARHLSLSDVSEQIHIRSPYLEAIENDDSSFAAPVYVRGFVRTYARFLGLDAEAVLAQSNANEPRAVNANALQRKFTPLLWIAAFAAAVLVGFVAYKYVGLKSTDGGTRTAVALAPSSAPNASGIASPEPTPKPTARPKDTLVLRVSADSWISIKVDGTDAFEGILKAGTVKDFHGKNADVRAGNAGGVDLTLNGKELGKMGNSGEVVERTLVLTSQ